MDKRESRLVLCVDDQDANRYARRRVLAAAGFDVIEASDGAGALRLAAEEQPALIVLDVRLPDVDGFEVCKRLKTDPKTRFIPILHVSAAGEADEDLPEALAHHSDAYLHEPIEPRTLVATARALIRAAEAEGRQRAAEERARRLLESVADPVVAFDREWRYTYVSERAAKVLGKTPEEMLGKRMWDLFPDDANSGFEDACGRAWREGRPVTVERYSQTLDEWVENYIYPLENGASTQWRDVTERKRAERALAESEARYHGLFESMQEGFCIGEMICGSDGKPTDWRYIEVNPAMAAMIGRTREEILGHTYRELFPEAAWEYWVEGFGRVALSGVPARLEAYGGGTRRHYDAIVQCPSPGQFAAILTDVTDRRRALDAAQQHREWLTVTLGSIGDAVLATDDQGSVTFLNSVAASLTGWGEAEAIGRPAAEVFRIVNEDTGAAAENVVERVLREGATVPLANHSALLSRDGRQIPVSDSAAPIRNAGGHLVGAVVVFHDVTKERQAQQALRDSEAQFRTLANAIPQLCWIANADGWIFWYNARWYEYTGTTPEQMEGWGWQSVHDPEALPEVLERWKASIATAKPFDMVFPLRGKDGVFRPFLTRIVPLMDAEGRVSRWFGTNTDVSEQRTIEEALRASEARERERAAELKAVLDAVPAAIFIAEDPECRRVLGSRMTYEMLRVPQGVNLSKSAPETERAAAVRIKADGRDLPTEELPVERAAATGRPIRNFEFELEFPDGKRLNLLGDAAPILDEQGRPRGAVGAFLDITERKRQEERLRETQKLESVGLLAGGIAHDFNNLLTGIIGNSSMLLEEAAPAVARTLREVIRAGERAAQLTRQLLAYAGKGHYIVRDLDVSRLVSEIAGLVEFSIPRSVNLAVGAQRRLPAVRMDPGQLQQVLMNLVINAGEAIGEGNPGRITVGTSLVDVDEPFRDALGRDLAGGRYVCIEVADNGPGMDEATKAKIFDPFFSTKFTGRGLGLAAVAGILRSQKGAITVDTAEGRGSTFRVYLPATEAAGETPEGGSEESGAGILVVDDDAVVREFLARVLRRNGYRVLAAEDGKAALPLCKRENGPLAAIVLDVVMPVMGAREALPLMREEQPGARILLTSGYSEEEARRLCAEYPGAAFLQKPYTAQQFVAAVKRLITTNTAGA